MQPATSQEPVAIAQASSSPQSTVSRSAVRLPDGVYLYGQSAKPNEIGKGYFVFESRQGNVVGALYMPSSSFDCAAGTFTDKQLSLTVTNSYDRTTNPFDIALARNSNVASNANTAVPLGLEGFQKLDKLSANDYRILKTCKADLQKQAHK
jgi:hypothetical protein